MKSETSTKWEQFLETLSPQAQAQISPATADIPPPQHNWHLLICADGHIPELKVFADVGMLRKAIIKAWPPPGLLSDDVYMFVIFGVAAHLATTPKPTLIHPDGTIIPLYDVDEPLLLVEAGLISAQPEPEVEFQDLTAPADNLYAEFGEGLSDSTPALGGNGDEPYVPLGTESDVSDAEPS